MAVKIEKDTIIGDVLDLAPETAPLFQAIGMHCLGCPASRGESVEEAAWSTAWIRCLPRTGKPLHRGSGSQQVIQTSLLQLDDCSRSFFKGDSLMNGELL